MTGLLQSITKRSEFARLRESGVRKRSGSITVTFCSEGDATRLAMAVPRKVGGAVARNKLRRRLRSIFREATVTPGMYLVSAAPGAAEMEFEQLRKCVLSAAEEASRAS